MVTHLYTICWNEADILPFFFRHYDPWIDHYIVFDNGSTDESIDILKAHPRVEFRQFPWAHEESFILSSQALHNQIWKESRGAAQWVVITAIDEHLHAPGVAMRDFLMQRSREGVTLIPALGYQMISEEFPNAEETLCRTRTRGTPWRHMSKLSLFDPDALEETNFEPGRHEVHPLGRLKFPRRDELLLLHYKLIGFERTLARHASELTGLRSFDLAENWHLKYALSRAELRHYWDGFARNAVDISNPRLPPWATHLEKRWWRSKLFNEAQRFRRKSRRLLS